MARASNLSSPAPLTTASPVPDFGLDLLVGLDNSTNSTLDLGVFSDVGVRSFLLYLMETNWLL